MNRHRHHADDGTFHIDLPQPELRRLDPATGDLAGPDIESQTKQILDAFDVMLTSVGSDLDHVIHINVFLANMQDFDRMNAAYVETMGDRRPARTAIAVSGLPKPGALLTMNLTAVTKE